MKRPRHIVLRLVEARVFVDVVFPIALRFLSGARGLKGG